MNHAKPAEKKFASQREESTLESRRSTRRAIEAPIEFAVFGGERRAGMGRNISVGGLQINTDEPAPFGASVTIFMRLPDIDEEVALPGTVRWTAPRSMGVQLGLLGARVTHALVRLLEDA